MTIDAYKKEIQKEFARGRKLTSSSSKYTEKTNTNKVWLCESVGKLKRVGQPAIAKMNELRIHMIADLQLHVHHHVIPKVPILDFDQIYDMALQDIPRNPSSSFKDYRKAKNPYLSIYGWTN